LCDRPSRRSRHAESAQHSVHTAVHAKGVARAPTADCLSILVRLRQGEVEEVAVYALSSSPARCPAEDVSPLSLHSATAGEGLVIEDRIPAEQVLKTLGAAQHGPGGPSWCAKRSRFTRSALGAAVRLRAPTVSRTLPGEPIRTGSRPALLARESTREVPAARNVSLHVRFRCSRGKRGKPPLLRRISGCASSRAWKAFRSGADSDAAPDARAAATPGRLRGEWRSPRKRMP